MGMMGSGKTTVGETVAARVGAPFFDTDRMVVELARLPIPEIWESLGEEGFRLLEAKAVAEVPESDFIAAAGGGAVILEENRRHIERGRPVVWLRGDPSSLADRIGNDRSRPLLDTDESPAGALARILAERSHLYHEVATDILDVDDMELSEVVAGVVEIWRR